MSVDGMLWTEPTTISENGMPVRTDQPPGLAYDGTLYHLYWKEPDGSVRFAASSDAQDWLVQQSALARIPPDSSPSFAFGAGRDVVAYDTSRGTTVIDLGAPAVSRLPVDPPLSSGSLAFGMGYFWLAGFTDTGEIILLRSTDSLTWRTVGMLRVRGLQHPRLSVTDNGLLIAAISPSGPLCRLFSSADGQSWSESPLYCGGSSTGVAAARLPNGNFVYLSNWDNRLLMSSGSGNGMEDTHARGLNDAPAIAVGRGRQLLALKLEQVRIARGSSQDVTVVALGFNVRVGTPGSAHVSVAGTLKEIASGLDVDQFAAIPWTESPFVLQVLPEQTGKVDIAGAAIVGIERGDCPVDRIYSKLLEIAGIVEQDLNDKIASASLSDLLDEAKRNQIIEDLQADVKSRLGEGMSFWAKLGCGFNVDEALEQKVIVFIAAAEIADDPTGLTFKLDPQIQEAPLPNFWLTSPENPPQLAWEISSRRTFLPLQ
jgi:hypothetical protein